MNTKNRFMANYRSMLILALIVGVIGIAFQFVPDFGLLSFMLTIAVLGSLIGGENGYDEQDRQQLGRSYKTALEGLLLAVLIVYAFIEFSRWFVIFGEAVAFLNGHWPGLTLSMMCIAMGIAGFQKRNAGTGSA
jgi:hypothetical protein